MKKLFLIIALCLIANVIFPQSQVYVYTTSKNNDAVIEAVTLTPTETIIYLMHPRSKLLGGWVSFSSNTILCPYDDVNISSVRECDLTPPTYLLQQGYVSTYNQYVDRINEVRRSLAEKGYLILNLGNDKLDTRYTANKKDTYWELHFKRVPYGVKKLILRELIGSNGFEWVFEINNPYPEVPKIYLYSEEKYRQLIDAGEDDGIVGIYDGLTENKYRLACIKDNGVYKLVYLSSGVTLDHWNIGDVKAILEPTATYGAFKAIYYMQDKTKSEGLIAFDGATMSVAVEDLSTGTNKYIKMYPTANGTSSKASQTSLGSGFALKNGYVATNYHVVENAKSIKVKGINGNFSKEYIAVVEAIDKQNDIAVLKIQDASFTGFGAIPYSIKSYMCDVGESVWTLGYPMTDIMGDEVKFTDGKISSRTGFQGDVSVSQISVPIQPGNSGGALFDSKGNIVGITSSGINRELGTENVNYAIKTSYLRNLIESSINIDIIPNGTSLIGQSLPNQIKQAKSFIFIIECK